MAIVPHYREPKEHKKFKSPGELALYLRMSDVTIRSWLNKGIIKRGPDGLLDSAEVVMVLKTKEQDSQERQTNRNTRQYANELDSASQLLGGSMTTGKSQALHPAAEKLLTFKAEKAELEYKLLSRECLNSSDVQKAFEKFSAIIIGKFQSFINRSCVLCDGLSASQIRRILTKEFEEMTDEIKEQLMTVLIKIGD